MKLTLGKARDPLEWPLHTGACTLIWQADSNLLLDKQPPCLQQDPVVPEDQVSAGKWYFNITWVIWPYIAGESLYPPNGSPLAASKPAETRTS